MPRRLLLLSLLALSLCAAPASAATWTSIPSGTSGTITAIEYQSPTRFWYTTAAGEIWTRGGDGTFTRTLAPTGQTFNDIEFQPSGAIGLAVGNGGQVWRSTNSGASWTQVTGIPVSNVGDGSGNKCTSSVPLGDVNFVRFTAPGKVWLGAGERQIARSAPADAATVGATGTWVDANRKSPPVAGDNCWITTQTGFTDLAPTANPDVFYLLGSNSYVYYTTSGLTSTASEKSDFGPNGTLSTGTLAIDVANPNRLWGAAGGSPYGNSGAVYTEDGFANANWISIGNSSAFSFPANSPYDVDYAGGTTVFVGNANMALNSVDGRTFYQSPPDTGTDWRSVSLADAANAAIGGLGGNLRITSSASTVPDIVKPAVAIAGPGTAVAGQPVTFTANASDNAGGTGIDPNGFAWSATGVPVATGTGTRSFTFPSAGSYTVRVSARDVAGNVSDEATKTITVGAAPVVKPPAATFPASAAKGITVKKAGRYFTFKVKGTLLVPAGVAKSAVCPKQNGMKVRIKKGKKTIKNVRANLSKTCSYAKTIKVLRKSIGKAKSVTVVLEYPGNAVVGRSLRSFKKKV
jgi:hypothetical protein